MSFLVMKIKKANAGALTNFEVLDFLRSKGASKDPNRIIATIAPSELKVYDYLVETAACNQTTENISSFLENCKEYDLAKAEILNIINIRPAFPVEIDPMIEQLSPRLGREKADNLLEMLTEVLPPPPNYKAEEEEEEDQEGENISGEQMEAG